MNHATEPVSSENIENNTRISQLQDSLSIDSEGSQIWDKDSFKTRRNQLQKSQGYAYDLVIIGGGITGAGVALDAVSRGLKVALIEKGDFGSGASSRSTKMIHGGLRYLQKCQLRTVAQAGKERDLLLENAPHVIFREKLLLPLYKEGTYGRLTTALGLKVYDFLISAKKEERSVTLSRKRVLDKVPNIRQSGLLGAVEYTEYQADDARLTLEVIKKAQEMGADCFNYLEAVHFNQDVTGAIESLVVKDVITENQLIIKGQQFLNAAGAWIYDFLPEMLEDEQQLRCIQGSHIVFDQVVLPVTGALYFDTGHDHKMIFAVGHGQKTYVGVSSGLFQGERALPKVSTTDVQYLLTSLEHIFPELDLNQAQIESSWSGIASVFLDKSIKQSKVKNPIVRQSDNGLLTVMAGRLSGYRALAEKVVDKVVASSHFMNEHPLKRCQTARLTLSGGNVGGSRGYTEYITHAMARGVAVGFTAMQAQQLSTIYGSNVDKLFLIAGNAQVSEMHGLPLYLYVRLMYGMHDEFIVTPNDFFIRRTGMLYFDIAQMRQYQSAVIACMANYYHWTTAEIEKYSDDVEQALRIATESLTI